ncbi:MAG: nickel-responsive transcriptional regulator NikR [Candidatus Thorarchaeota archaeon]|nr:MAG: nickel-responsive transcriptional regulator NikR [Candidatus Thorarchaeota archaeon]
MKLKRFGVSVPEDLLERFDVLVAKKEYVGRSEAIRDAMRLLISQDEWESEQGGKSATLTIVYKHKPSLMTALIESQHGSDVEVIATTHVHLSHAYCLEVMTMRGSRHGIEQLAYRISGLSGITFSRLFTFSLPDEANHTH